MKSFRLILGSQSKARASVLNKLALPYEQISPDVDESPLVDESAESHVLRLAISKAQKVAKSIGELTEPTYIIGSDQIAHVENQFISKPSDHADAVKQLQKVRGKSIQFYTGLCLLHANSGQYKTCVDPFTVHFREFTDQQIESYLLREQPYNCAGSLRCEGLGITLIAAMHGKDPNTLIGLPLIDLISLMKEFGLEIF